MSHLLPPRPPVPIELVEPRRPPPTPAFLSWPNSESTEGYWFLAAALHFPRPIPQRVRACIETPGGNVTPSPDQTQATVVIGNVVFLFRTLLFYKEAAHIDGFYNAVGHDIGGWPADIVVEALHIFLEGRRLYRRHNANRPARPASSTIPDSLAYLGELIDEWLCFEPSGQTLSGGGERRWQQLRQQWRDMHCPRPASGRDDTDSPFVDASPPTPPPTDEMEKDCIIVRPAPPVASKRAVSPMPSSNDDKGEPERAGRADLNRAWLSAASPWTPPGSSVDSRSPSTYRAYRERDGVEVAAKRNRSQSPGRQRGYHTPPMPPGPPGPPSKTRTGYKAKRTRPSAATARPLQSPKKKAVAFHGGSPTSASSPSEKPANAVAVNRNAALGRVSMPDSPVASQVEASEATPALLKPPTPVVPIDLEENIGDARMHDAEAVPSSRQQPTHQRQTLKPSIVKTKLEVAVVPSPALKSPGQPRSADKADAKLVERTRKKVASDVVGAENFAQPSETVKPRPPPLRMPTLPPRHTPILTLSSPNRPVHFHAHHAAERKPPAKAHSGKKQSTEKPRTPAADTRAPESAAVDSRTPKPYFISAAAAKRREAKTAAVLSGMRASLTDHVHHLKPLMNRDTADLEMLDSLEMLKAQVEALLSSVAVEEKKMKKQQEEAES